MIDMRRFEFQLAGALKMQLKRRETRSSIQAERVFAFGASGCRRRLIDTCGRLINAAKRRLLLLPLKPATPETWGDRRCVMSALKPGTLCVIVGGCPENLGMIVEVVAHLGRVPPREDAYRIVNVTGRVFPQLRNSFTGELFAGYTKYAITDRHKLRPLPDVKDETDVSDGAQDLIKIREDELLVVGS
jgi:hypothetical protein